MSAKRILPTKLGDEILDIEFLVFSPEEIEAYLGPQLRTRVFSSKREYQEMVVKWLVPHLDHSGLADDDYRALYYRALELHPTIEFETRDHWSRRGFRPDDVPEPGVPEARSLGYEEARPRRSRGVLAELDLEKLAREIRAEVIGQDRAVDAIFDWLHLVARGATADRANLFCGYLMGPSGVGKTSFIEVLSEKSGIPMKQFSGSEYQDAYDAKRFLGSAPGLVGYDEEGGPLQKFAAKHPEGILLFDEADKMHPSIWTALTNFLDRGVIQDGKGKELTFRGLVFFTSNIGYSFEDVRREIGFGPKGDSSDLREKKIRKRIEREMPFEIIGRIHDFFHFQPLSKGDLETILELTVARKNRCLDGPGVRLCPRASARLVDLSFDPKTGARNLRHVYERHVLLPIVRSGGASGIDCHVTVSDEKFIFDHGAVS